MHDIDHGRAETEFEQWEAEGEQEYLEAGEFEFEDSETYETESESLFCENGEMCEAQETELALEFLEITNEAELEAFLGNLMQQTSRWMQNSPRMQNIGKNARQIWSNKIWPTVKDIGTEALKGAAGAALTAIGKKAGAHFGNEKRGENIGGAAAKLFGFELEGLSGEDQEFEAARGFVRFAGNAAQNMIQLARTQAPQTAVQNAVVAAARVHAPGLLAAAGGQGRTAAGPSSAPPSFGHSGRWMRRGRKIVLYGV